MSLLESLSTAPCTPSLADLSIAALSLAPGSAAPPSLVAGLRTANRSALKKRQRRKLGAGPNTLVSHASQPRGCAGGACFVWTCTSTVFEAEQCSVAMPPVGLALHDDAPPFQGNLDALEDAGA